jgi:hypothetical protein
MQLTNSQVVTLTALSHAHSHGALYPTPEHVAQFIRPGEHMAYSVTAVLSELNGMGVVSSVYEGYRINDSMVAVVPSSHVRKCDLHGGVENAVADVKIPGDGRWGNVCLEHFNAVDAVLGLGQGQLYVREA